MTSGLNGEYVYQRWQQLNDWLSEHRALWQPVPFAEPDPDWVRQWPALAARVASLPDADCQHLADDPVRMAEIASDSVPSLHRYDGLTRVPPLHCGTSTDHTLPEARATDMPGRKRLQSGAFATAILPLGQDLLDWCCGKGHLARTLAPLCPGSVSGWEWNPALVADGNRLARKFGDDVSVHCQDVMAEGLTMPEVHVVALHACGDLHRRLMTRATANGLPRLSFSPCCYHLTAAAAHQPLSWRARAETALALSRNDLRLAVQETVTAPLRERRQARLARSWRLGFDGLQRHLRGVDAYLPVPSHPVSLLQGDFAGFCRWAASSRGLALPAATDFERWQNHGIERLWQVRRHELVRHLFRRPLELWLVLDYALFLQEQGYEVRLGTFCDRQLTPRNLLIDAWRAESDCAAQGLR